MVYTKTISQELKTRLEDAFEVFKTNVENPLVIALIKHPKAGEQIYLIAKDPNEETYYGIMEGQFSPGKQIFAIPTSNITCIEFIEEKIKPFKAKPYLENGRFDYPVEEEEKVMSNSLDEIQIGKQIWMKRNLSTDKFRNGDIITEAKSAQEWDNACNNKKPAYCIYDNDSTNGVLYGKLYNWYAVNDSRGLSPIGWKIPSNNDWITLINHLGGEAVAGSKLIYRRSLLSEGSSISGFDGFLGGRRLAAGHFLGEGNFTDWWSSTEDGINSALSRGIKFEVDHIGEGHTHKGFGYYVRCLKDY